MLISWRPLCNSSVLQQLRAEEKHTAAAVQKNLPRSPSNGHFAIFKQSQLQGEAQPK
jgi:hypothetical protein